MPLTTLVPTCILDASSGPSKISLAVNINVTYAMALLVFGVLIKLTRTL